MRTSMTWASVDAAMRTDRVFPERDAIADIWGTPAPYYGSWPHRVDERFTERPDKLVYSSCVLCSIGCGLEIGVKNGRIVGVRGRATDVVNRGRLGPKGLHGWEANHAPDRLRYPLIRRDGKLVQANWDEAMKAIVEKSKDVCEQYTSSAMAFYTSGQLFLEEYYTLAVIGKAGLGTPHMDGNTRLCTATSAAALKETFGADGQAGTFLDIDTADCILAVGHNIAETGTVLWTRIRDRRNGPQRPKLIVIDPRVTPTAREADVHLAPRLGTNVAVLNGLLKLLISNKAIDEEFIRAHTIGFEQLRDTVSGWTADRVEHIAGIAPADLRLAAGIIGDSKALLSTCLQGVYQSNQATAAAVQVNNINLIRGMIGRPGCGILQMNGQPTAQNTREAGADGDLPGFRNWENPEHIEELARLWNVETSIIPHWAPPTHALQIMRYCETGSIRFLWIQGTNPAISLPHLARMRKIFAAQDLFIVVQDCFLTETAELADVVLPAAIWGEKTGCFTNADRTVHISHKAVEPPGEARTDLEIFLDYAKRMDFRDKDGAPLIKWASPEEAFEAWKECSRGRPCDYTGLTYKKLSSGTGIPWPCNDRNPDGNPRPYASLRFPTDPDYCETFGHDLITGAARKPEEYRALNPAGRAFLKGAEYISPLEEPDQDYPFFLTTGRVVYQFHTRTKTGRADALREAAPESYVQISTSDAARLSINEGDFVRISSRRGSAEARARIGGIGDSQLFMPFHFGYWDHPGHATASNELCIFDWDPVSKQPHYKYAAVRIVRVLQPTTTEPKAGESSSLGQLASTALKALAGKPHTHVSHYLSMLQQSEQQLIRAFQHMLDKHPDEPDIQSMMTLFGKWSASASESIDDFKAKYGEENVSEPKRLADALLPGRKNGGYTLLRDLHNLWLLVNESVISLIVLKQATDGLRDASLRALLQATEQANARQRDWLITRIKQAAPQTLIVPQ
jgi:ferredoxin-nitrate reductase